MKKNLLIIIGLAFAALPSFAQRTTDKLDRGLVAMKASTGVYLSWRLLGSEYYDVTYNVYRDGNLIKSGLSSSNYSDASGSATSTYTVSAVVRGKEQAQCKAASVWTKSYKEIKLTHEGIQSTLVPNDACCADIDGDGELEILMKFDNESEIAQSYPKNGPSFNGKASHEYSIFEALKQDGKRLWWVNCGPNMGDFQNNEQNIVAYDWDGDGKAEAVMRAADGTTIHCADGTIYTVGDATKRYAFMDDSQMDEISDNTFKFETDENNDKKVKISLYGRAYGSDYVISKPNLTKGCNATRIKKLNSTANLILHKDGTYTNYTDSIIGGSKEQGKTEDID